MPVCAKPTRTYSFLLLFIFHLLTGHYLQWLYIMPLPKAFTLLFHFSRELCIFCG